MKIFKFRDIFPQLPNIALRRRFRFCFELLPYEAEHLSLRKIGNMFMAGLNQFIQPPRPIGYPVIAQVEPTNFCNLSCPICFTVSETGSRPTGMLSFDRFRTLIDEMGDYLLLIVLWNWGEPFLNTDIFRIIEYAKSKNIIVHSSTNGNVKFDAERADKLVGSGLDSLVIGVDGATQETYGEYRKGGNLDQVLGNIRAIVSAKKRLGSKTPRLNFRFVVMKHNEKEIPLAKQLAENLETDFFTLKTVDMPPGCGEKLDSGFAPANRRYRRYEYEPESYIRKGKPFVCLRPWKRITLDALGDIIPCEYDYKSAHSFGTLNAGDSAVSIWKGNKAKGFRSRFNRGNNDSYLCKDCTYKNSVADDCTVEMFQLNSPEE